jgi:hypothetical protein
MTSDQGDLFPAGPFFVRSDEPYCADCGADTIMIGEWYMVTNEVWEQAWAGRRHPRHDGCKIIIDGTEILCIGCLEKRIGRTLVAADFPDMPVNG